ncbi:capsid protein [Capybara virus 35_cap1_1079]|nr:capsid protein [Capybara virus 35_cap1_1079]
MARMSVRSMSMSSTSRKIARSRQLVNKAAQLLRKRNGGATGAPLAARGFRPFPYGRRYVTTDPPELKYIDVAQQDQAITNTGGVVLLNAVATGTDVTGRVGRKINMKSLKIGVNVFNQANVSSNLSIGVTVKISIVYDSQPNGSGTVPTYTTIYKTAHPYSPLNLDNRDRFKVLWTKNFVVAAYTTSASSLLATGSPTNTTRVGYKKMNLPVIFGGTGATIGDIQTGALYITAVADVSLGAAFDYNSRIRFIG